MTTNELLAQPQKPPEDNTIKSKWGWLPTSVWHLEKGSYWKRFIDDRGDPTGAIKKKGAAGEADYPYSIFNPILAERVYRYWSNDGDNVLDPFAGRTTRGLVARVMGRHYEGYEVAPTTYEQTKENLHNIENCWQPDMFSPNNLGTWALHNADGTLLEHTTDNSKDLIFTCPPYWKVEVYEVAPAQLSRIKDYDAFMALIQRCALNCCRTLKRGKYCVFVVNDFRQDGQFYPFHADTIAAFRVADFHLHDIVINQINSPFVTGAAKAVELRRTLKMHEYALVWRKGDSIVKQY